MGGVIGEQWHRTLNIQATSMGGEFAHLVTQHSHNPTTPAHAHTQEPKVGTMDNMRR